MKNSRIEIVFVFVIALMAAIVGMASNVTISWIPPSSTNVNAFKIYAWTNSSDTNCLTSNAIQTVEVGNVTNATLTMMVSGDYSFAVTSIVTNTGAESPFSNFTYWHVPSPPTYLIAVQSSTNLITWSNTPVFFRLQIQQP